MPDKPTLPSDLTARAVIALDGVYYAALAGDGRLWRAGSVNPDWRDAMRAANPVEHGVFLQEFRDGGGREDEKRLALLCCGLGSVWPGMGRELYESFPAARQAMEEIAAIADWDVLGLMAEASLEKISQTRTQIPYLFMLEYAQWRLFHALGLSPALISGHSLGELVALCLAGVYDLPTAWYLLDTRAEHMAELEAANGRQGGMLAVPAPFEQILPVLKQWPALRVANRNTLRQYILGGPICQLREARKQLRRAKVPAILLNMDLAFHNPAMRILRDISLLRLNSLPMHPPRFPVLSCVDAKFYPDAQPDICRRIADLDENTVDWVGNVESMSQKHGITHFLELGPQETLCGLVAEIDAGAICLAADSKGHEAQTMRNALASLFASGFLDLAHLAAQAEEISRPAELVFPADDCQPPSADAIDGINEDERAIIVGLLAQASHKQPEDITPGLDLRRDLGLRSSTFPFLVLEAEEKLGRPIAMATIAPLATVADAVRFLAGLPPEQAAPVAAAARYQLARLPLLRLKRQDGEWRPALLDPALRHAHHVIVACLQTPDLLRGAADAAARLAEISLHGCQPARLERFAAELQSTKALAPDGIVLELPPDCAPHAQSLLAECAGFADTLPNGWLLIIGSPESGQEDAWFVAIAAQMRGHVCAWRAICRASAEQGAVLSQELADMLAREIRYGTEREIIWKKLPDADANIYCRASRYFDFVYPAAISAMESGVFEGYCQFSRFRDDLLNSHGADAMFTPLRQSRPPSHFPEAPWLPLCRALAAMRQAAALVAASHHFVGLTDARVYRLPALPAGVTRLCRASASARTRFPLSGIPGRLCRVDMDIAELTPSGRQNERWQPLARASFMAAKEFPPLEMAWPRFAAGETAPLPPSDLANFYSACGFGPPWRQIRQFSGVPGYLGEALLAPPAPGCWSFELLLEGALQTALLLNALPAGSAAQMAENMARWRFAAIGLARFAQNMPQTGEVSLRIRLSWHDSRLRRYDGQIIDAGNNMLLAFHNLEFDCVLPQGDI